MMGEGTRSNAVVVGFLTPRRGADEREVPVEAASFVEASSVEEIGS
jgi:hypothetical protein